MVSRPQVSPGTPIGEGPPRTSSSLSLGGPEAGGCPWVLQGTGGRADRDPGRPDVEQRSGRPGPTSWQAASAESLLLWSQPSLWCRGDSWVGTSVTLGSCVCPRMRLGIHGLLR